MKHNLVKYKRNIIYAYDVHKSAFLNFLILNKFKFVLIIYHSWSTYICDLDHPSMFYVSLLQKMLLAMH